LNFPSFVTIGVCASSVYCLKLQSLAAMFEFVMASQRCGLRSLPFRFGCRSSGAATMEVVKRAAVVGRRRMREAMARK